MTLVQRFPYAALASPLGPDDRDRFAARLMGSRGNISLEVAGALAARIAARANRRRPV